MNGANQPPQGLGYPPYRTPQPPSAPKGADSRAITSMVLGIVGVVFCCLPVVGIACGTIAIVLFVKFNKDFHSSGQKLEGHGMGIAGLVTGIIGVAFGLLYTVYWVFLKSAFLALL